MFDDCTLLIAAIIRLEHDLVNRDFTIVGGVEEAARVVEQLALTLLDLQIFSHHNNAVRLLTRDRSVLKLRDVFLHQFDVLKFTLLHNPLFHISEHPGTLRCCAITPNVQAKASGEQVVGDIQHVIGFRLGEIQLP